MIIYLKSLLFHEEHPTHQSAAAAARVLKIMKSLQSEKDNITCQPNNKQHDKESTSKSFIISLLSNFFHLFISYR